MFGYEDVLVYGFTTKQIDSVVMGSPLELFLAKAFLSYCQKNWLNNCQQEFKTVSYRRYVDYIFILFKSYNDFKFFQDFLIFMAY